LEQVLAEASKVDDMESTINEAQRKKDQLESSLRTSRATWNSGVWRLKWETGAVPTSRL